MKTICPGWLTSRGTRIHLDVRVMKDDGKIGTGDSHGMCEDCSRTLQIEMVIARIEQLRRSA